VFSYFCMMARILAVDYGTKRVGLAVTDPLQLIATGLDTIQAKDIFSYLENYFKSEQVECVVVGEPRTLMNRNSSASPHVNGFVKRLKEKYPQMRIERLDERFTSQLAQRAMLEGGLKKKDRQNKETVDRISAVIILQDWLSANPRESRNKQAN
jgi:putative holliday junction resolvase